MRIGNWPLVWNVLEHVITYPDQYRQHTWGLTTPCGTVRCIAGWIAEFGGWKYDGVRGYYINPADNLAYHVEETALILLDLDAAYYGSQVDTKHRTDAMWDISRDLFNGGLDLQEILISIRELARIDGVTPTPLILTEMTALGVITDWTA